MENWDLRKDTEAEDVEKKRSNHEECKDAGEAKVKEMVAVKPTKATSRT